jgi:predicted  nucleic acid-binding Zn-ribbon protein
MGIMMPFLDTLFGTARKAAIEEFPDDILPDSHIKRSESIEDMDLRKNPLLKKLAKLQKEWQAFMDEAEKIQDKLANAHAVQDAAFKSGVPVPQADLKELDEEIPRLRSKNNEIMLAANEIKDEMDSEIAAKYSADYY